MSEILLNLDGPPIIVLFRIVLRWMENAVVVKLGLRFVIPMGALSFRTMLITYFVLKL